jgi:uncharacterized membrane protein YdbT with pleckstrin-like domain
MKKPEKPATEQVILWRDRKRTIFGLPLSFTVYTVTEEKFIQKTGLIRIREDEVRLYRIMDVCLTRNLEERLFGIGTLGIASADKSLGDFKIKRIKKSKAVRDMISSIVEQQRTSRGIVGREFLGSDPFD